MYKPTVAEEFVLLPVTDNNEGTFTPFLVLGLLRCTPTFTPVAFNGIQRRHERFHKQLAGESTIVSIVQLNHP